MPQALVLARELREANEAAAEKAKAAAQNYRDTGGGDAGTRGYYDGEASREDQRAARFAAHAQFWGEQAEALEQGAERQH